VKWLRGALALGYPFLIFAGLQWLEPRTIAWCVGALFLLRWLTRLRLPTREEIARFGMPAALVGGVLLATALLNDALGLLLFPVAMNLTLLVVFGRTLREGPSLIESLARLKDQELSDEEMRHCWSFTAIWCVFFVLNSIACLALAVAAPTWLWTLYTGLLAYLLMGLLFAAEFLARSWRFGRYDGTLVEPLFRRIFRPPPSRSG
jgi:uncharacterized membrane protein